MDMRAKMSSTFLLTVLCSSFLLTRGITGQGFNSPCPGLFQYLLDETTSDSWSGQVALKTDEELSGVYLRLIFDNAPTDVTSNFGEVVQREANEYLIRRPNYKLSPSSPEVVKITVTHGGTVPRLTGFRLNAKDVCSSAAPLAGGLKGGLVSPCPGVFQYDPQTDRESWTGVVTLSSEAELSGIYSRLVFDKPPLEVTADFGDVVQRETNQFLIRKPGHKLPAGTPLRVKLVVRFESSEAPPRLTGIQLNAKAICPGAAITATPPPLAKGLVSPCPKIFSYQSLDQNAGKWHGLILLNVRSVVTDVQITILLDRPSLQLGDWRGYLRTQDNIEYTLTKPGLTLQPGSVFPIKFFIKYKTSRPIPKLSEIFINQKGVCPDDESSLLNPAAGPPISSYVPPSQPGPSQPAIQQTTTPGPDDEFFTGSLVHFMQHGLPLGLNRDNEQCGVSSVQATPFITHGQTTISGQHPWHAALYHNKNVQLTYICGANLISKNYVLTVAHCATKPATGAPVNARLLVVVLGKYYLERLVTQGIQERNVKKITVHPNYDKNTYKNDIALLQLDKPTTYTETVRPICLWTEPEDIESVIGKQGTVVGWGFDETGKLSDQLMETKMPVVRRVDCIISKPEFFAKFTSELNYCAGFGNGSSACNGDSGGGMAIAKSVDNKQVWNLRGLVSLGSSVRGQGICDPTSFVIFTDVAKYIGWLRKSMTVKSITVHPNYDKNIYKNDIALLQLDNPTIYTDLVRPICLWSDAEDISTVVGKEGTVVGWGWNENGKLSDQLVKTNMPIVDRLTCVLSKPEFFSKFTNEFSYCAGFRNGSSACNGDSGGGMAIAKTVNNKQIWNLRGLVSVGVALQNLDTCDSSQYVVFTDVAKYLGWIRQNTH